ncbi:hypothetical protein, partial [Flavobacterium fluviatile]|uniref:hypothetical protein n=1 Tax=Flavobacterium fluviatile TaxID=1862387 RepID=UPI001AD76355
NVHPLAIRDEYIELWKNSTYNLCIWNVWMFGAIIDLNNKLSPFVVVLFIIRHEAKIKSNFNLCNTSF